MPLSQACILRGTKGTNQHCCMFFLWHCELPLNAFPRAALEMCYRGSEIENNILNGPSAPVLFLASGERGRGGGEEGARVVWPLNFTQETCSPQGFEIAAAWGNMVQFQCSFSASGETLSASFTQSLWLNSKKEAFSVKNRTVFFPVLQCLNNGRRRILLKIAAALFLPAVCPLRSSAALLEFKIFCFVVGWIRRPFFLVSHCLFMLIPFLSLLRINANDLPPSQKKTPHSLQGPFCSVLRVQLTLTPTSPPDWCWSFCRWNTSNGHNCITTKKITFF